MITSNYQVDGDIYSYADKFFCDSHDDKPSNSDAPGGLINGTILEETDTGKTYIFDKKANQWTEKAAGGGGGSTTLAGLTDVDISNPSNGQTLVYNAYTQKWENGAKGEILNVTYTLTGQSSDDGGTATCDHTYAQIAAAFAAGKNIVARLIPDPEGPRADVIDFIRLSSYGDEQGFYFSGLDGSYTDQNPPVGDFLLTWLSHYLEDNVEVIEFIDHMHLQVTGNLLS